jgi:hypothetical protein
MQALNILLSNKPPQHRRLFPPEPAQTRTQFAVNLQLGRSFSSLVLLVRAGYDQDPAALRRHSVLIASAILRGARDRARQPPLRTLLDQQRRSKPLARKRSPRELPVDLTRSYKVAA